MSKGLFAAWWSNKLHRFVALPVTPLLFHFPLTFVVHFFSLHFCTTMCMGVFFLSLICTTRVAAAAAANDWSKDGKMMTPRRRAEPPESILLLPLRCTRHEWWMGTRPRHPSPTRCNCACSVKCIPLSCAVQWRRWHNWPSLWLKKKKASGAIFKAESSATASAEREGERKKKENVLKTPSPWHPLGAQHSHQLVSRHFICLLSAAVPSFHLSPPDPTYPAGDQYSHTETKTLGFVTYRLVFVRFGSYFVQCQCKWRQRQFSHFSWR